MRVVFFGVLREVFGASERSLEVRGGGITAGDALARLAEIYPAFERHRPGTACAQGDHLVSAGETINPGEPLVLLPPVSGG